MDYVKNREEVRAPYWQRLEERIGGAEGREIVEAMKEEPFRFFMVFKE